MGPCKLCSWCYYACSQEQWPGSRAGRPWGPRLVGVVSKATRPARKGAERQARLLGAGQAQGPGSCSLVSCEHHGRFRDGSAHSDKSKERGDLGPLGPSPDLAIALDGRPHLAGHHVSASLQWALTTDWSECCAVSLLWSSCSTAQELRPDDIYISNVASASSLGDQLAGRLGAVIWLGAGGAPQSSGPAGCLVYIFNTQLSGGDKVSAK